MPKNEFVMEPWIGDDRFSAAALIVAHSPCSDKPIKII